MQFLVILASCCSYHSSFQLILPFTPIFYYSHISLLTTVSVWQQGLQDVFKSLPLMSCWGWPSVFASPTEAVPGTGSWLPPSTRLLLGVIMCAGSGSPTGVHEFVLYRHSSLSQSRHSEGREPCRDGVDFRGLLFITERGLWAAKVESLSPHCSISPQYHVVCYQSWILFYILPMQHFIITLLFRVY